MDGVIGKLIDAGNYLKDEVIRQKGLKEKLKRLGDNRPKIQSVVAYASTQLQIKDQNPDLDKWLWQLRDAIDEVDDVLDDWEYMKHKEQLEETQGGRCIICHLFDCAHKIGKRAVKFGLRALNFDPDQERLEAAVKKLDDVSADVDTFIHLAEAANQEQQKQQEELYRARETGAMPKNDQIGRDEEKDFVLQWLTTKPSNEQQTTLIAGTARYSKISLLSIVGLGGMGKTTLLQHVYEDETTKEFDLKIWVCVSNNFDVKKVIVDMLEYLKMERPRLESSLATLQESLKSAVTSKKFLLVLDDIWDVETEEERNIHENKWENVLAPLAYGSLGSKILVTTRMDSAASMMANVIKKKKETLILKGLEEAECLRLFNSHAFVNVENPDDHSNLRSIAREIVKKLSGSPLAARVLGGVLKDNLDERHWERVLNSDLRSAEPGQSVIMSILRLSYIFLPKYLQSCFAFCCIFPQDHRFNKDDLVRMWTALNFIQPPHGGTAKDTGERYFDVLIKKSLFDEFQIKDKTYYKIHDLLHDMLRSISAHECSNIVGDNEELVSEIPETVRHLFVNTNNPGVIKKMEKFKNLRSLYFYNYNYGDNFVNALDDIFKILRSIRLLYIHNSSVDQLPEKIGELMHLRYLKIAKSRATLLPRSLSNLYHLKFMTHSLLKADVDSFLPNGVGYASWMNEFQMFSNLEYIKLKNCYHWETLPPFGQLPSLKSLYLRNMPKAKRIDYIFHGNGKDRVFPSLEVLEITNLKALEDWFGARAATDECLFPCLTDLCLKYCPNLKELPSLPPKLKKLEITDIGWKTLNWLKGTGNCCSISIEYCPNVISLNGLITEKCQLILNKLHINDPFMLVMAPLGRTISLKKLEIAYNDAVVSFPANAEEWFKQVSSSLCELRLYQLKSLQSLPSSLESLSSLKILMVWNVPQLQVLPNLPSSLDTLELARFESLQSLPSSLESLSSLKMLQMDNLPQLQVLSNLPASLEYLYLYELKSLQSLPSSLENLSSLKFLLVWSVPQLQVLPNLPASLKELKLLNLESLQSLPSSLESLSSLKTLMMSWVSQLQVLPNLPASLEELELEKVESLQSLPSSLGSLSSLKILKMRRVPQLQVLPNLPDSLEGLHLYNLKSLQSLPSSLESLSSLATLRMSWVPQLQVLPNLPASLKDLDLEELESLQSLPSSLGSLSSLKILKMRRVPQLQVLPNLPASLEELNLSRLKSLQSLPSSLESLSSLKILHMYGVPQLQVLPNLPASLEELRLIILESLQSLPSSLESLSSLQILKLWNVPQLLVLPNLPASLKELELEALKSLQSLPSSLESLSSLKILKMITVPQLQVLPNLPASLKALKLEELESLQSLPSSLESLSSLRILKMKSVPQLQVLPNLPASLEELQLDDLESLDGLPSFLPSLSSLQELHINKCPQLSELPDVPPSLKYLTITSCHPELTERYRQFAGSEWHKIAHIPSVNIH